ncbi:expressed protein [Phakopsora pachyrhizi]|uniref:Expressed protein n=1 Tax=Phakopsora pachyrhizi TaxID=170000 RepID=A0AAV0BIP2_PHAPC|nr:expressed protein [Phakopsora pachyrhizi]
MDQSHLLVQHNLSIVYTKPVDLTNNLSVVSFKLTVYHLLTLLFFSLFSTDCDWFNVPFRKFLTFLSSSFAFTIPHYELDHGIIFKS